MSKKYWMPLGYVILSLVVFIVTSIISRNIIGSPLDGYDLEISILRINAVAALVNLIVPIYIIVTLREIFQKYLIFNIYFYVGIVVGVITFVINQYAYRNEAIMLSTVSHWVLFSITSIVFILLFLYIIVTGEFSKSIKALISLIFASSMFSTLLMISVRLFPRFFFNNNLLNTHGSIVRGVQIVTTIAWAFIFFYLLETEENRQHLHQTTAINEDY